MTAFERVVEAFEAQGLAVTHRGGGRASAQAPGHSPADRSVTITETVGQVLVHSHSDPTEQVLDNLGLHARDLFDSPEGVVYRYNDGREVYRTPDKKFRQKSPPAGILNGGNFLYQVHQVMRSDGPIYMVEGEKDVHALEAVGAVATCTPMGAGKAHRANLEPLHGKTVIVVQDKDEPGRKHAAQVAELLDGKANVVIVEAKVGKDAADHIAAGMGVDEFVPVESPVRNGIRRLRVTRGSDVVTKRVHWIMPDWIPAGSLTLLAGREGLGKSTIAAAICAEITQGTLEGELRGTPRNVLYVHTEDAREFTVAPRLKAAGANMDRVLFVDVQTDTTDDGTLILPYDVAELEKVLEDHEIAFVVLDAATSSMSSELSGKDDRAVRQYLEPLSQLAARRECVVFGLCHFGKRDGADTGKLILGSIAWSQVARSVLSVALDEDSGHLVVTNTKGNLAPRTRSMEAQIVSTTIPTEDGDTEVGRIEWLGESTRDARELLQGPEDSDNDDRTEAQVWLEDYLTKEGKTPAKVVKVDARKEGISEATIKRAAKKLKVIYGYDGFPRTSVWSLPAQSEQSSVSHDPTEPTEPTGPDQGKQDEPTVAHLQLAQSAHGSVSEPTADLTVIPFPQSVGSTALATMPEPSPPAHVNLCSICGEHNPGKGTAHVDCILANQSENAGYVPKTPGAQPGRWIGSGNSTNTTNQ